ncbi:translation initiation factor 2 beta subunit, putative, partial [Perkinsus marinus ATCC 50983]
MTSMVNIPSDNDDPAYRYKMPKLVVKIEGRGNGIKTNIVNMVDVARALKRPPSYPTKFFGCELGAQSKFDEATDKAIVNGEHQQADMQSLLDKFIERYVLCQNCHLPEIDMSVKKGDIKGVCKACGWRGNLDMTHKVATFILKNPPQGAEGFGGIARTGKKDKAERQREKAERQRK